MTGRIAAIVMAAVLVLYLVLVGQHAVLLILTDDTIARIMGVALSVLPVIGAWALTLEILFVLRGERLVRVLGEAGGLPVDDLPRLPSGRPDPKAADAQFPVYQARVEAEPESWSAWLLLGLAYDASGDHKRARWATRTAIRLERASRQAAAAS